MPVERCVEDGKPGYRWGKRGKCYTYAPGDEKGRAKAKQKAYIQGLAMGLASTQEGGMMEKGVFEIRVSNKPWSSVNKSKLPKSAFLWIEGDGKLKSQWHLPYKDETGAINLGALRAISAAVAGARTGKPMSIPPAVRKKLDALLKRFKIGKYAKVKKGEVELDDVRFFEKEIEKVAKLVNQGVVVESSFVSEDVLMALSKGAWG